MSSLAITAAERTGDFSFAHDLQYLDPRVAEPIALVDDGSGTGGVLVQIGDIALTPAQCVALRGYIEAGEVDVGPDGRPYARIADLGWVEVRPIGE